MITLVTHLAFTNKQKHLNKMHPFVPRSVIEQKMRISGREIATRKVKHQLKRRWIRDRERRKIKELCESEKKWERNVLSAM